ncbi:hypothetical protein GCM10008955_11240 [Deinococcus malanensis]|uniref:Uncharacterized protein n=1 Tax=Deinococcus malanensis TaxID=1706855 RepID=A0ABQ2EP43_9DEIO|nr:hypothetical protein [Deinococcus malanensis]GGK19559.1 hypothetical protein GCM10008955_11240 [Deinococcus malanensis]
MNIRAIAATLALSTLAACGQTDLAAQSSAPTLATQAERTVIPISRTQTFTFESPCTGEMITGTTTVTGQRSVVTDANGGRHIHERLLFTGTYQGDAGTTFTDRLRSRIVINRTSSGALTVTDLGTGHLTGSDGTKILDRGRFALVVDANGVVRVERGSGGAICQRE